MDLRIQVLWRGDPSKGAESVWYSGTITQYDPDQDPLCHLLTYDDGDREWCDMETLEWREEVEGNKNEGMVPQPNDDNSMMYSDDHHSMLDGHATGPANVNDLVTSSSASSRRQQQRRAPATRKKERSTCRMAG
mgnify:CR=1 FL=1